MKRSFKNENGNETKEVGRLDLFRKRFGEIPVPPGMSKEEYLDLVFKDRQIFPPGVSKEELFYEIFAGQVPPDMTLAEYLEARYEMTEEGYFRPAKKTPMERYIERILAELDEQRKEIDKKSEE